MISSKQSHYIPGKKPDQETPLERYLPPFRHGVVSSWLTSNVNPGSWLIDPFGASPELIIEAASAGHRVLTCVNNPITRFIIEFLNKPLHDADFQTAIAHLASFQVGDERLEPHIKSLYETNCYSCGQLISAEAFIWKRGETVPSGRIYTCPHCGDHGERSATSYDEEKASLFIRHGLHRARALERVTPLRDPDRHHVEEAIEVYLPRAIYALITIINKIVRIPETDPNLPILRSLILIAFDHANTLWSYPKVRQRPKQLTIPPQYLEHNIWLSIETATKIWTQHDTKVPITKWPEEPPPDGGICIFDGRIRSLVSNLEQVNSSTVITSFPRPNQAFWTLSALWSGWLWGHGALDHYKSVLRRRRYDWSWHINAIHYALNHLAAALPDNTKFFGLINEVEPGFLSAVLLGCQLSNLKLNGIALREEEGQAQINWQINEKSSEFQSHEKNLEEQIFSAIKKYLSERGEPSLYAYLHAAGLVGLVSHASELVNISPGAFLSNIHSAFQDCMTRGQGFIRYGGSEKSLDVGLWWRKDAAGQTLPLSDRIEISLINHLSEKQGQSFLQIDEAMCKTTAGLSPPDTELIFECLRSYCTKDMADSNHYSISDKEHPHLRVNDIQEISNLLLSIGSRLGYKIKQGKGERLTIHWLSGVNQKEYIFHISSTGLLGKFLELKIMDNQKPYLVIPGSRANLIAFKLKQNPYFNHIVEENWGFIKYRLVRQLAEKRNISSDNIEELFNLDPITYSTPQIRMF